MLRNLFLIVLVLLIAACTSRTIYKKPSDLIAKDEMVAIWTDLYVANSAHAVKNRRLQRKVNYMPLIYNKYKIDSAQFMRSNIYYTSRIEVYEELFQKVEANLNALRDIHDPDMKGIDRDLPVWQRDSIKRARKINEKKDEIPVEVLKKTPIPKEPKK